MLFCLVSIGGCGKGSGTAPSASRSVSSGAAPVPPSPSIADDTDEDDEANVGNASDGDNDDHKPTDGDNDSDSRGKSYFDADDSELRRHGHTASRSERRVIVDLVERYYRASVAGDGEGGCMLMAAPLAKSLPQTLSSPSGPPYTRGAGSTCPPVLRAVFLHYHRQLAAHLPTLSVSDVRLEGSEGNVVLRFKGLPGRFIDVARERGAWKVDAVVDLELP